MGLPPDTALLWSGRQNQKAKTEVVLQSESKSQQHCCWYAMVFGISSKILLLRKAPHNAETLLSLAMNKSRCFFKRLWMTSLWQASLGTAGKFHTKGHLLPAMAHGKTLPDVNQGSRQLKSPVPLWVFVYVAATSIHEFCLFIGFSFFNPTWKKALNRPGVSEIRDPSLSPHASRLSMTMRGEW